MKKIVFLLVLIISTHVSFSQRSATLSKNKVAKKLDEISTLLSENKYKEALLIYYDENKNISDRKVPEEYLDLYHEITNQMINLKSIFDNNHKFVSLCVDMYKYKKYGSLLDTLIKVYNNPTLTKNIKLMYDEDAQLYHAVNVGLKPVAKKYKSVHVEVFEKPEELVNGISYDSLTYGEAQFYYSRLSSMNNQAKSLIRSLPGNAGFFMDYYQDTMKPYMEENIDKLYEFMVGISPNTKEKYVYTDASEYQFNIEDLKELTIEELEELLLEEHFLSITYRKLNVAYLYDNEDNAEKAYFSPNHEYSTVGKIGVIRKREKILLSDCKDYLRKTSLVPGQENKPGYVIKVKTAFGKVGWVSYKALKNPQIAEDWQKNGYERIKTINSRINEIEYYESLKKIGDELATYRSNVKTLKVGMNPTQVKSLMGEPIRKQTYVERDGTYEDWTYSMYRVKVHFKNNKLRSYSYKF